MAGLIPADDVRTLWFKSLKVRKKMLVRMGVPPDERDMLVSSQPKVFYFTDHYKDYPMILLRLSKAKRAIVEPLLRRQKQQSRHYAS